MQSKILLIKRLLEWVLSRAAALLLISMTALVIIQVVSRYLFQSPTAFTEEIVRYTLIWTGFIGAAYAFSTRQHMALIFFRDKLSGNSHKALMVFIDLLIMFFALAVMTEAGSRLAISVMSQGSPLLGISRGIVYAMAPVSGIMIAIAQLINLYEDFTGIDLNKPKEND